jgi:hypothetical protein
VKRAFLRALALKNHDSIKNVDERGGAAEVKACLELAATT